MNFAGATAVLGTRHGKERVIAPILDAELGIKVAVLDALDTDQFGTFTREIPRVASFRDTARAKARAALAGYPPATWGIASEGSFGPHPSIAFIPGGIELVLLITRNSPVEIAGLDVTVETNYASRSVTSVAQALEFAVQAAFPAHGLIVMPSRAGQPVSENIQKGIVTPAALEQAVATALRQHGQAWIETDMRAHLNPTRMRSIERATRALVANARRACPHCSQPGFQIVEHVRGLPCADCGAPTQRARAEVFACAGCGHRAERPLAGAVTASPGECDRCNP